MIERFDKCPNCFKPHNGQSVCAHCGFDIAGYKNPQNALPPFTVLEGKYKKAKTALPPFVCLEELLVWVGLELHILAGI